MLQIIAQRIAAKIDIVKMKHFTPAWTDVPLKLYAVENSEK